MAWVYFSLSNIITVGAEVGDDGVLDDADDDDDDDVDDADDEGEVVGETGSVTFTKVASYLEAGR